MSVRRTLSLVAATAVALLFTASLGAQARDTSPVPSDLIKSLISATSYGLFGRLEIRVDQVAEGFPPEIIPATAKLLGSMMGGDARLTVLALPMPHAAARDTVFAKMLAAGMTSVPVLVRSTDLGFASSVGSMSSAAALNLCRGQESFGVDAYAADAGSSIVIVSHLRGSSSRCMPVPERQASLPPTMGDMTPFPSLLPPPNAVVLSSGGGSSGSGSSVTSVERNARITTAQAASAVLSHYTTQMRTHGWTPVDSAASTTAAVGTYEFTDRSSVKWFAVINVLMTAGSRSGELTFRGTRK